MIHNVLSVDTESQYQQNQGIKRALPIQPSWNAAELMWWCRAFDQFVIVVQVVPVAHKGVCCIGQAICGFIVSFIAS